MLEYITTLLSRLFEIETEFENAVYQGPRWVRIMKKTGGRKSRDTLPLSSTVRCYVW